jgi:hypothetical protein
VEHILIGFVVKAPENSLNQVGSLVGLLVGPGEDWKNVTIPSDAAQSTATTGSSSSKPANQASQATPASDNHHASHDLSQFLRF